MIMSVLKNLLKIKSIVTIVLIGLFVYVTIYCLKVNESIPAELITIVSMVVGYYFGTQKIKEGE